MKTLLEIADHLGKSVNTIKLWRKQGMPGSPGKYDIREVVHWLRATIDGWQDFRPECHLQADDTGSLEQSVHDSLKVTESTRASLKTIRVHGKPLVKRVIQRAVDEALCEFWHQGCGSRDEVLEWCQGKLRDLMKAESERLKKNELLENQLHQKELVR